MHPRLLTVIAFFSVLLAAVLLPGVGFLFAAGAAISWWEWKKIEPGSTEDIVIPAANPLQLTTALIFAMLLLAVSLRPPGSDRRSARPASSLLLRSSERAH